VSVSVGDREHFAFSILLPFSLVLNIAAVVSFVLLANQSRNVSQLKKEKNEIGHKVNLLESESDAKMIPNLAPDNVSRFVFMSHLDNREDCFALAPPEPDAKAPEGYTLIVYLHGLGASFLQPFTYGEHEPIGYALFRHCTRSLVLSCSYRREGSFGNDEALADITQNIRMVGQKFPIKEIILFGESMGGMTALNYGAMAPKDIQDKLKGIVSMEGTSNLLKLHQRTKTQIQRALEKIYGPPGQNEAAYINHSFCHNVHRLPQRVKVAVVSALFDDVVPPGEQNELMEILRSNNNPSLLLHCNTGHSCPPENISLKAFDFANQ
jgi:pimeloyl-ACP methyl ester carboxylesterase